MSHQHVPHAQALSGFAFGDRGVHREAVEMIKPLNVGPLRQVLPAQLHKFLLKAGDRFSVFRIAGRDDTTLAGVVAEEFDGADVEWFELAGRAK